MRSETKFGTFEDLIFGIDANLAEITWRLRTLIATIHPEAVEVVRLGDRAATYGVGPKKITEAYTYIMPQKQQVNLGFFRGLSLPDPEGLLEGTGKAMRHVKLRSVEEVELPAICQLLEAALAERQTALGLTKKTA